MDFRLLGPLEVFRDHVPVQIAAGKQRALIAVLLLNPNRTVSREQLIDALWGEDVPESAQKMVQIHVSQLRKALPEPRLHTRQPGYSLEVGENELDVARFERAVADGRRALAQAEPEEATELLTQALALWRGPALAEFAEPFAGHEGARLEELRLAAVELRIEAELALGHQRDVVGELETLIAQHPLREHLRAQHMLALYRSGRHAEALASYQTFRRTLSEELGIEPSASLRELERQMLQQDPSLEAPARGSTRPVARASAGAPASATTVADVAYARSGNCTRGGDDAPAEPLTFLFADLESSTRLWEQFPDAMKAAMERHDEILRAAVNGAGGRVVKTTGDGLMAVFASPSAAVAGSLEAQRALQREPWGKTGPLRVRIAIHVGEAHQRATDFYGPPVNRTARIMAAAHGGQVLLSADAARLADWLPEGAAFRDLGEHRLKDLAQPEHIFQLTHPDLVADLPPLATLSERPNNLPTQTSEFLGREIQLSAIRDLLDADRVRLLTLTGPGGIGKTRLALQAAANQIDRFEHGVYFIDLSPVGDRDAVFQAVVRAVGVSAATEEPPLAVLKQEFRTRQLLLVLDNFEQVVDAADAVVDLLRHCPGLKTLVTSREALRVRGEHLFTVPPLALPEGGETAAELLSGYEAVRLFIERAREVQRGFALTDENAAAVADICARLDGLPLAIELAAASLTLFSPDELRDRLDRRLDMLRRGPRDLPARQQTLRRVIEWSHDLLKDEERALFRLLSVFVTARLEAIEEVAARLESLRQVDVVELLASLVDKSLVRSTDQGGQRRLSMLETIREYAAERLDDEPELAEAARRAHAEYFCGFTRSRRERLYGPGRESTLDELGAELGNLLVAWRYWVEVRQPERLNSLLDGLWVLNEVRGWYHATIELANDLLGVLSAVPSTPARLREEIALRTSLARGLLAIRGYTQEAEAIYGRALALAEQTGDLPQRAPVVRSLASFYFYRGEFDRAAALGRELIDLAKERGDTILQVDGELVFGASVAFLGDVATGMEHLDRAMALFDTGQHLEGFRFGTSPGAAAYTTSALLEWLRGHPDRSAELSGRAIDLAEELNHPFTTVYIVFHTAVLDLWRGKLGYVHERAGRVLEVAEEHHYPIWKALALMLQGSAAAGLGRPDEGVASMEQGVDLYQGLTTPAVFWPLVLSIRAQGFAYAGRPNDGLRLIDEAIETVGAGAILYPGFALLRTELLIALADTEAAVAQLRSVVESAGRLGLPTPQLRAAKMLVRLGKGDAVDQLRTVYETFTEGFDDPDLVDARATLVESNVPVG